MRLLRLAAFLCLLAVVPACARAPADLGYTPGADADALLAAALEEARAGDRKVLLVAGGDWCRWCHVLDRFLGEHADVDAELHAKFVVVKLYYGEEDTDWEFFERLPEAEGFPHFWVVGRDGGVRSYETGGLEKGDDDYDAAKFLRFIREAAAGGS